MLHQKYDELHKLAKQIGEALGPWYYDMKKSTLEDGELGYFVMLRHSEEGDLKNAEIHIEYSREPDKLSISGGYRYEANKPIYPSMLHRGSAMPSIRVSTSKTPAKIAQDIVKRFLPDYTQYWTAATAWAESMRNTQAVEATLKDRLIATGKISSSEHFPGEGKLQNCISSEVWGSYQITMDHVDLSLRRVPIDIAVKILEML